MRLDTFCHSQCIECSASPGAQASGEAIYAADTLKEPGCLHAAFVASTEPLAVLKGVDAGPALALPGVVAYFGAGDIPGTNKSGDAEELFATDKACGSSCCFAHALLFQVLLSSTHNMQRPAVDRE